MLPTSAFALTAPLWLQCAGALAQSALPATPAPPPASGDTSLTAVDSIRLVDVTVQGSTVFTNDELAELTAPLENQSVSFEQLQELRHELSRRYVARGYVTSGIVIPDQRVTDGVVVMRAVEGELTDVEVEGNHRLRSRAIERRVRHYLDTPLNITDLEAGLSFLQQDPLVARVNAQLVPGESVSRSASPNAAPSSSRSARPTTARPRSARTAAASVSPTAGSSATATR